MFGALALFEIFNFDTSRFGLESLLGLKEFFHVSWASILAVAFCAIDSLSLVSFFGPEAEKDEYKGWLLLGAWGVGATLNACLTWWAMSITMLAVPLGNEVLSREDILLYAPAGLAVLVLITRIALIGTLAFSEVGNSDSGKMAPPGRRGQQGRSETAAYQARPPEDRRTPARESVRRVNGSGNI